MLLVEMVPSPVPLCRGNHPKSRCILLTRQHAVVSTIAWKFFFFVVVRVAVSSITLPGWSGNRLVGIGEQPEQSVRVEQEPHSRGPAKFLKRLLEILRDDEQTLTTSRLGHPRPRRSGTHGAEREPERPTGLPANLDNRRQNPLMKPLIANAVSRYPRYSRMFAT